MRILLADDEPTISVTLSDELREAGHDVMTARDGKTAAEGLAKESFDLLITDLRMPGMDGVELMRRARARTPELPVVVITAYGSVETAVAALRAGATDYLLKPFLNEEVLHIVERLAMERRLREENRQLRETVSRFQPLEEALDGVVARSPRMREVLDTLRTVAPSDATVLLEGESGTGKEVLARALHRLSPRHARSWVAVSCAALPQSLIEAELFGHERGAFTDARRGRRGRFELADRGTIFLDDVDDLPLEVQVKLLRVLQERTFERVGGEVTVAVDVRVVAATKIPLRQAVREGSFREDLYYRLHVVPVKVAPLRERREDIPALVEHFLRRHGEGRALKVPEDVLRALEAYAWPGNVRELENAIERACVLAGEDGKLRHEHLLLGEAPPPSASLGLKDAVRAAERSHILRVLGQTRGKRTEAAALLGITRKNLWEKMKDYGIEEGAWET